MNNQRNTFSHGLTVAGAVMVAFSVVMGILVLFVISNVCPSVSGLQLIFLSLLFVIGVIAFLLGIALGRKKRKSQA
jgi:hypothetical protein